MASNKENQIEDKDDDNLVNETISKSDSREKANKLKIVSEDNIHSQEEDLDEGFSSFGFNKSILSSLRMSNIFASALSLLPFDTST